MSENVGFMNYDFFYYIVSLLLLVGVGCMGLLFLVSSHWLLF